ncbi:hypothetical protein PHMEG_00021640, partial [Phytophthora megakarya]
MKRFLLPEEKCAIAMTRGVLDILTVVEQNLIERAIKWVKREIRQRCDVTGIQYSKAKWRGFWDISSERGWSNAMNVAGLNNELVACTNNPLERFNRELRDRFLSLDLVWRLSHSHVGMFNALLTFPVDAHALLTFHVDAHAV